MVGLLTLGILGTQARDGAKIALDTRPKVVAALRSLGYVYTPGGQKWISGKLTHDGATVDVGAVYSSGFDKGAPYNNADGLSFSIELAFPQEVRSVDPSRNPEIVYMDGPATFSPHLGRTVSVSGDIMFKDCPTRGSLRRALGAFWKATADYARHRGGRFAAASKTDWTKVRFPDGYVLACPDVTSVGRALDSWGFFDHQAGFVWGRGWRLPLKVHGVSAMISGDFNWGDSYGRKLTLSADVERPPKIGLKHRLKTEGKRHAGADFSWSYGNDLVRHQDIRLERGVSLGDLRRRIESFAANVAALQKKVAAPVR